MTRGSRPARGDGVGRELEERLADQPVVDVVRSALVAAGLSEAWLVGGLLRDLLRGVSRARIDLDVAVPGTGCAAAFEVSRATGGTAFPLDEEGGAWRVALPDCGTVDLIPLRAEDISGDLAGRDFTVNAMAFDLLGAKGFLDPLGGRRDLAAAALVPCSDRALLDDPIRVLRAYRFAAGLGLTLAPGLSASLASAASHLDRSAPERVRAEVFAVLALPAGAAALRAMAVDGVWETLFPFVKEWRGFDQGDYHAYDLFEHSLRAAEAAESLADDPAAWDLPRPQALREHLGEELEAGLPRLALLKFVAFFHDVAKPATVSSDGLRRRFLGHDVQGGRRVRKLLEGLRVGRRARAVAQATVAAHLRLFGLSRQQPPTKAARLRYLRDLRGAAPEGILLSLADEIATGPEPPVLASLSAAARELLSLHWEQRGRRQAPPLLRGRDVVDILGVREGPAVGEILRRVGEAEARGEVGTRAAALAMAEDILRERETPSDEEERCGDSG